MSADPLNPSRRRRLKGSFPAGDDVDGVPVGKDVTSFAGSLEGDPEALAPVTSAIQDRYLLEVVVEFAGWKVEYKENDKLGAHVVRTRTFKLVSVQRPGELVVPPQLSLLPIDD